MTTDNRNRQKNCIRAKLGFTCRVAVVVFLAIHNAITPCDGFECTRLLHTQITTLQNSQKSTLLPSRKLEYSIDLNHKQRKSIALNAFPMTRYPRKPQSMQQSTQYIPMKKSTMIQETAVRGDILKTSTSIQTHPKNEPNYSYHVTNKDYIAASCFSIAVVYFSMLAIFSSGPGSWRYYLAGGICASVSHTITTPIDVVKTRQQVDPNLQNKGFIGATLAMVRTDGMKVLLSGLGPTTIGYLFEGAAKFGIYEVLKPTIKKFMTSVSLALSSPRLDSHFISYILCGSVSGLVAAILLCPMEALRIRQVAEPEFSELGTVDGGITMVKQEGVYAFYKSLLAMISKQVPYTVTKQVTFDGINALAYAYIASTRGLSQLNTKLKFMITLLSAFIAGASSAVSSQPGDTLLSLVNAHQGKKTTTHFAKDLMRKQGIRGFFVGMNTRFLHVGVMVTIQLLIYDVLKQLCGIPSMVLD